MPFHGSTDRQVANGMLMSELEEAKVHANEAGQLKGEVADLKVDLPFLHRVA